VYAAVAVVIVVVVAVVIVVVVVVVMDCAVVAVVIMCVASLNYPLFSVCVSRLFRSCFPPPTTRTKWTLGL